jgi:hypothetical protein
VAHRVARETRNKTEEEGSRGFLHNKRDEVPQWRTLGTILNIKFDNLLDE